MTLARPSISFTQHGLDYRSSCGALMIDAAVPISVNAKFDIQPGSHANADS